MTIKKIRKERIEIQKLIRNSNKMLLARIKKKHPKLIRLIKKRWDVNEKYDLIDAEYYIDVEYHLIELLEEQVDVREQTGWTSCKKCAVYHK